MLTFYYLKYNYISINCDRTDLDELKELTQSFKDIQCYTDFTPEEFKCKNIVVFLSSISHMVFFSLQ